MSTAHLHRPPGELRGAASNAPQRVLGWAEWRGRRGVQLLLLTLTAAATFVGRTSLAPLQEAMRMALGLGDNQMALLQGPPLAVGVLGAVAMGLLLDRQSRARWIILLGVLGLLGNVLTLAAPNLALLFVARCLAGLSTATIWTAILSLLGDWYPPNQRGRAAMVAAIGAIAGMAGAFALGGTLLARAGSAADGWRFAMSGLAVPLAAGVLISLALVEPARVGSAAQLSPRQVYQGLWHRRRQLWPLMVGFALVAGIADGAALIWAAPTLSRQFALPADRVGAIMGTVLLLTGVLGPVLGGALADVAQRQGGPHRTMTTLSWLLLVSVPTGLFALAPGALLATLGLALFLLIGTAFQVAQLTLITIVMPSEMRASCVAWTLAMGSLFAFGLAPLIVSQLSVVLGGPARIGVSLTTVCLCSSLVGALLFYRSRTAFQ